mmetsp:Transcript_25167/g.62326  ORF Transcript_25167/g.62326 Transcript_25167/m.62326 type:complete len:219 (-) Transcript_25167:991-1647(-)
MGGSERGMVHLESGRCAFDVDSNVHVAARHQSGQRGDALDLGHLVRQPLADVAALVKVHRVQLVQPVTWVELVRQHEAQPIRAAGLARNDGVAVVQHAAAGLPADGLLVDDRRDAVLPILGEHLPVDRQVTDLHGVAAPAGPDSSVLWRVDSCRPRAVGTAPVHRPPARLGMTPLGRHLEDGDLPVALRRGWHPVRRRRRVATAVAGPRRPHLAVCGL